MFEMEGPNDVPGFTQGLSPRVRDEIMGVKFFGYVEDVDRRNARQRFRRVRSQRNAACETDRRYQTPEATIYTVVLARDLRTPMSCTCKDMAAARCKHMILVERFMRLFGPRRS